MPNLFKKTRQEPQLAINMSNINDSVLTVVYQNHQLSADWQALFYLIEKELEEHSNSVSLNEFREFKTHYSALVVTNNENARRVSELEAVKQKQKKLIDGIARNILESNSDD